jgi:hypothetical protein
MDVVASATQDAKAADYMDVVASATQDAKAGDYKM